MTGGDPRTDGLYIGIVRIRTPPASGGIVASEVKLLGARVGGDFVLGWQSTRSVLVDEAKCPVTIVALAGEPGPRKFLTTGERECIVDFARSSSPPPVPPPSSLASPSASPPRP